MITDISKILNITLNPHVRRLIELLTLKGYSVDPHPANPRWLNVYCPIKGRNIIKEKKPVLSGFLRIVLFRFSSYYIHKLK
jgi:hypothetical protein